MHPWVAILGFLLLLTDGVMSYREVIGVVGQSVTLPCFYEGKVTSMCWGRGKCSWIDCRNTVISTDGYKITKQKNERYKLEGDIGKRDVSLTIENAVPSDSGLYCCRIQKWLFNDEQNIIKLTIKPAPPMTTVSPNITSESTRTSTTDIPSTTYTTPPTRSTTIPEGDSTTTVVTDTHMTTGASTSALPMPTPTDDDKPAPPMTTVSPNITSESTRTSTTDIPSTTYTTPPTRSTTIPEGDSTTTVVTDTHMTTGASTSALPMPTPTDDDKPGGNHTVIKLPSAVCCSIQTGIYIGISVIVVVLLLMVLVFMISKRSLCLGNKMRLLCMIPLKDSHIGALKNAAMKPVRAEDNIYVMDEVL
ncbi:hepatitis A virus cellular receptor 1 homolog isoform X4 [Bubalus bubalis]|uniref:hepatitis A virus cellular receptor 1 homolog isoform X4 n=1 Tax=Bubalus bubalis TaxID=89462 RepID=UPI000DBCA6ED|nr:hepatitis A virus cellular receptor 1 homolog isoform X4 [Bubalus bubalis]